MTVALARRLVWDGIVTPEEANQALHAHVTRRIAFLAALLENHRDLAPRLEAELGPRRPGTATAVIPDRELVGALPPGAVAALLAVPVGRDARTGAVRVLAADPSDPHIAEELSYHLGAPVEVGRAPLRQVLAAIDEALAEGSTGTPAFGTRLPAPAPSANPSEPPIPLVRVNPDVARAPATVKGVAPQGASRGFVAPVVVGGGTSSRPAAEPIIELTRAKSTTPPKTVKGTGPLGGAPPSETEPAPSSPVSSSERVEAGPTTPARESRREELDRASSPEEVIGVIVRGLSSVARRVLVLAVRGKVFEGRDANDDATRAAMRTLVISADRPSVLLTAVQTGSYVGPIPETRVHAELAGLLGGSVDQIAVGTVSVSGRAAVVYVMAGFDTAYLATRRAADLAQAAGKALERIVRGRRK